MRFGTKNNSQPDTYFFDNSLSFHLAEGLRAFGEQVEWLRGYFPENTPDTIWIPEVAAKGWVALARDKKIRTRAAEMDALVRSGLTIFFFSQKTDPPDIWAWSELVVLRWREMKEFAASHKRPFVAGIPGRRGRIKRLR